MPRKPSLASFAEFAATEFAQPRVLERLVKLTSLNLRATRIERLDHLVNLAKLEVIDVSLTGVRTYTLHKKIAVTAKRVKNMKLQKEDIEIIET